MWGFESFSRCQMNHLRSFDFEWFSFVFDTKQAWKVRGNHNISFGSIIRCFQIAVIKRTWKAENIPHCCGQSFRVYRGKMSINIGCCGNVRVSCKFWYFFQFCPLRSKRLITVWRNSWSFSLGNLQATVIFGTYEDRYHGLIMSPFDLTHTKSSHLWL